MTRLGRRWRVLKWAGSTFSVLIVVAWAVSIPVRCVHDRDIGGRGSVEFCLTQGCLLSSYCADPTVEGKASWEIWVSPRPWSVEWWGDQDFLHSHLGWFVTPLWMPFLILAVPTARLWWIDSRRVPPGHCRQCGYNLTGNVSGVCPECGEKIADQAAPK